MRALDAGHHRGPTKEINVQWLVKASDVIPSAMIKHSFKKYGISNNLDETVTLKLWKTKRGQERARQLDSKRLKNDKVKTDPPTIEELKMAIKVMKNGKAPGSDGVTAEMLKVEDTVTPRLLTQIFSDIWETENIPED